MACPPLRRVPDTKTDEGVRCLTPILCFFTCSAWRQCSSVRNLPNGEVEVNADGDRAVLERLVERARLGPAHAVVTELHADWGEGPPRYSAFRVEAEPRSPR